MVPTSTRAHEHTSTRYPTYPAAERPDHTRQYLPCRSTEIRHQHTPRCASLPRHTATQAPTVSSIIPAARTETRHTRHATPQKRLTTNHHAQTVVHYTPKTPCHPHSTEVNCTLSNHPGGFATIDPRHADDTTQSSAHGSNSPKPPTNTSHTTTTNTQRQAEHDQHSHLKSTRHWPIQATTGDFATIDHRHAGDTPQGSAYGSNSPQATNENKPHHHNKHTKTSRTRPTQPPKEHTTPALPSNHSGDFATIDHRHAGDTPQSSAYGSNSPHRAQARPARVGT